MDFRLTESMDLDQVEGLLKRYFEDCQDVLNKDLKELMGKPPI